MQVMLAENIRAFRREKKLTQEQLAEVLGVTVGTVSKWESATSTPDVGLIMESGRYAGASARAAPRQALRRGSPRGREGGQALPQQF